MLCILLAAYNGEKYLAEQLESILCQTERDFHLYISDDCSTDGTFAIAKAYADRYPGRVFATVNPVNSGSCGANFLGLLYRCRDLGYDYFLFSDQDDVWLPDKIEKTLAAMRAAEASCGPDTPLLVFTDLRLVDKTLHTIEPSLWDASGTGAEPVALAQGILKCPCHGCTTLFNLPLAKKMAAPSELRVHDWWLYLTALLFGKAVRLPEQTVLYRQHGGNVLGAKRTLSLGFVLRRMFEKSDIQANLSFTYRQAGLLLSMYGPALSESDRGFLTAYAAIPTYKKLRRIRTLLRLRALKRSLPARIAQLMYC